MQSLVHVFSEEMYLWIGACDIRESLQHPNINFQNPIFNFESLIFHIVLIHSTK